MSKFTYLIDQQASETMHVIIGDVQGSYQPIVISTTFSGHKKHTELVRLSRDQAWKLANLLYLASVQLPIPRDGVEYVGKVIG